MSQQMRGLVESLLELARVDAGRAQDAQTELDLSALVNDALLPFEPVLFEAGHTLTARVEDGIRVRGNAAQLRQVVEILLDNARKYAQPGGWVLLTLARQGGRHCVLSVADPGAPLTPQECPRYFQALLPRRPRPRHEPQLRAGPCHRRPASPRRTAAASGPRAAAASTRSILRFQYNVRCRGADSRPRRCTCV